MIMHQYANFEPAVSNDSRDIAWKSIDFDHITVYVEMVIL